MCSSARDRQFSGLPAARGSPSAGSYLLLHSLKHQAKYPAPTPPCAPFTKRLRPPLGNVAFSQSYTSTWRFSCEYSVSAPYASPSSPEIPLALSAASRRWAVRSFGDDRPRPLDTGETIVSPLASGRGGICCVTTRQPRAWPLSLVWSPFLDHDRRPGPCSVHPPVTAQTARHTGRGSPSANRTSVTDSDCRTCGDTTHHFHPEPRQ